jgi:hypothetical protein
VVVAVVILIGAYIAIRVYLPRVVNKGVDVTGDALGKALTANRTAKSPAVKSASTPTEWAVTLTRPAAEVRAQLTSTGLADDGGRVTTPSGLLVELYEVPGAATSLTCNWDPATAEKPTAIVADVLRIVREVDPEAQVIP